MINATIYRESTGFIMMAMSVPDEHSAQLQCTLDPDFRCYIGQALDSRYWIFIDGEPVEREPMNLVWSPAAPTETDEDEVEVELAAGEILSISGIPAGVTFLHPDGEVIVDDGFIEWSTDHPGVYNFRLTSDRSFQEMYFNAIVS